MGLPDILASRYAPHRSWKVIACLPLLGFVVALLGPFGSYSGMGLLPRALHFAFCFAIIGTLVLEGSYLVARRFFAGNWPMWAALLLDIGLSLPSAAIVWLSLGVFSPVARSHVSFMDLVWQNWLVTLILRAGIYTVAVIATQRRELFVPPVTEVFPLAERLPFSMRRQAVLALSSEDHYLRVYTAKGEALIHMTLAEATDLLKNGFQVHRSHWVAREAIHDAAGDRVELHTGLRLPISRHRRRDFTDWLHERA